MSVSLSCFDWSTRNKSRLFSPKTPWSQVSDCKRSGIFLFFSFLLLRFFIIRQMCNLLWRLLRTMKVFWMGKWLIRSGVQLATFTIKAYHLIPSSIRSSFRLLLQFLTRRSSMFGFRRQLVPLHFPYCFQFGMLWKMRIQIPTHEFPLENDHYPLLYSFSRFISSNGKPEGTTDVTGESAQAVNFSSNRIYNVYKYIVCFAINAIMLTDRMPFDHSWLTKGDCLNCKPDNK